MEIAFAVAVAALAVALLLLYVVLRATARRVPASTERAAGGRVVVVLDVGDVSPDDSAVRRLVRDTARRAFLEAPEADEVEVQNRAGRSLGVVRARASIPKERSQPPIQLLEPRGHPKGTAARPPFEDDLRPTMLPGFDARERPLRKTPLASRFDLPPSVRQLVRDPDDLVDLLRAILEASGIEARVEGDLVRCGDQVLVVLPGSGHPPTHDELNHAHLAFRRCGAARGVVVSSRYLDPTEVRRRELLAPELRHAGRDAIQRMADAVAVGADPLRFVTGVPLGPPDEGQRDTG